MLWLKTVYPSDYYETFLNLKGEKGNELLVKRLIAEFREIGGTIQIIDLQNSKESFSIIDNQILAGGWGNIKGIGPALSRVLIANAPYQNWLQVEEIMNANRGKAIYQKMKEASVTGEIPINTAKLAELVPWFPVIQMGKFEQEWCEQYAMSKPSDFLSQNNSWNDSTIAGYLTAIHKMHKTGNFRGEQSIYILEDSSGQITARVAAKNIDTVGNELKA